MYIKVTDNTLILLNLERLKIAIDVGLCKNNNYTAENALVVKQQLTW